MQEPMASVLTVHPRVCGEQGPCGNITSAHYGSSPRVRGTGTPISGRAQFVRFIPACAGNSSEMPRRHEFTTVHPRVCGEQLTTASWSGTTVGSSPRVRGTVRRQGDRYVSKRFIPACAGNSRMDCGKHKPKPVHPRVCGEQHVCPACDSTKGGSSPRVRGTATSTGAGILECRFIPACAGNRFVRPTPPAGSPVHPRVCGEQGRSSGSEISCNGSSPRVRGTGASRRI